MGRKCVCVARGRRMCVWLGDDSINKGRLEMNVDKRECEDNVNHHE